MVADLAAPRRLEGEHLTGAAEVARQAVEALVPRVGEGVARLGDGQRIENLLAST